MESGAVTLSCHASPLCSSGFRPLPPRISTKKKQFCHLPLKLQFNRKLLFASYSQHDGTEQETIRARTGGTHIKYAENVHFPFKFFRRSPRAAAYGLGVTDWDSLGFALTPTDYMYVMKCFQGQGFTKGELQHFGNIELSPAAAVLNYGQGVFEGLKAQRKQDGNILLFRPEQNAMRMRMGAERMCMPSPTVEQFVDAVKATVLANERWIPPHGKGSLYIRPLLIGSGAVLHLHPSPEYTFLIYVTPVGNYFKEGIAPIHLLIDTEVHRAAPGGTGGIKTLGNYASVYKAQGAAQAKGYTDVLYLDCVHRKYVEEVSSCNVFVVKGNVISTPAIKGTILPGITRKSIIDVARSQGFQVEEQLITVEELLDADEVFCTGTAVVVSPVGSVTYKGERVSYGNGGVGDVSQQLYAALTRLQMGLTEYKMNWVVQLN